MQKKMSRGHDPRSGRMKAPLIALILLLSSATSIFAYPEPLVVPPLSEEDVFGFSDEDGSYELAKEFLFLLGISHEKAKATLDGIEEEAIHASVEGKIRLGDEVAADAYDLFSEGSYQSAMEMATEALQLYSEAIQTVMEAEQGEVEEDAAEEETVKTMELRDAIVREYYFLVKVRNTVSQLEKKGFDVFDCDVLVDEAEEHLLLAAEMLEDHDVEGADLEKSIGLEILDEAVGLLQRVSEEGKTEQVSKFLEKTEERLLRLEDRVTDNLGDLNVSEPDMTSIHQSFQHAKNRNKEIRFMVEAGEIDAALGQFKKVLEDEDAALGVVESIDKGIAKNLKAITNIEAKYDRLEEKIEDLKEGESNTTSPWYEVEGFMKGDSVTPPLDGMLRKKLQKAEDKLKEAEEQIDEAVATLEEKKVEKAEVLVDETEELVEEATETIKNSRKPEDPGTPEDPGPPHGE
jgi:flagellar motility protein MotE (MotC chaperone)